MNENILNSITRNLMSAWYLDLQFLVNLLEEHKIDFDEVYENVEMNFWKEFININYFIYETFSQIAHKFIEENQELCNSKSDEFEIYTNYMDSHLSFKDEEVQTEFENYS